MRYDIRYICKKSCPEMVNAKVWQDVFNYTNECVAAAADECARLTVNIHTFVHKLYICCSNYARNRVSDAGVW